MALITNDFITRSGIVVEGTTAVTSSTNNPTGALQVNSGAAIAKNLIVGTSAAIGTTLAVTGTTTLTGALNANGVSTFNAAVVVSGTNTLTVGSGISTFGGPVSVGGALTANGVSTFNAALSVSGANTLTVGSGLSTFGGAVKVISTNLANTVGSDGALLVTGGVYVGQNLVVASSNASTGTTSTNALYVAGGAGILGSMVVGGPTVFRDTVTFNGTATYVYSTNTVYTDNILELHTPPGGMGTLWTTNDAKDIGVRLHYYDATASADKSAFFGRTSTTGYFEYFSEGAEGATSFAGSKYGVIKAGTFIANDSTAATNATSGALQVLGGAGIGGAVYAGATVNGANVIARNLGTKQVVFSDAAGQLTGHPGITYDTTSGVLTTIASSAIISNNLTGGAAGGLPYQTASGTTAFLPIGANGYLLTSSGSAPTWTSINSLSASSASNIGGGATNQIPFQSGTGITTFSNVLTYTAATSTFSAPIISVSSTTVSTTVSTGAVVVAGGVGIAGAVNIGGKIAINDTTDSTSITTGAIVTAGGVGIAKNLVVGGSVTVGTPVASTVIPSIISNNMQLASFTKTGITGSTSTTLDTYDATVYRSARYTIQIVDGVKVHVTEITLLHNGTDVYINEYGISTSAGELGVFNASFVLGTVTLSFTPTAATSMTIKVVRMCITL